jgi:hypothetical protein
MYVTYTLPALPYHARHQSHQLVVCLCPPGRPDVLPMSEISRVLNYEGFAVIGATGCRGGGVGLRAVTVCFTMLHLCMNDKCTGLRLLPPPPYQQLLLHYHYDYYHYYYYYYYYYYN